MKVKPWVMDFETHAITSRECFPVPVGLAYIQPDGREGYVEGLDAMRSVMRRATAGATNLLFHNGIGFDIGVARKHLGVDVPIKRVDDTLVALALLDPHERIGLKDAANRLLGIAPDEADDLKGWIVKNVPGATRKTWGAHIAHAPRALREPYAIGDVRRTLALWRYAKPRLKTMVKAYRREIEATPILVANTLEGIRVDTPALETDEARYTALLADLDERIGKMLGVKGLDIDSNDALADAIEAKLGISLPTTEKGARATNKDVLAAVLPGRINRLMRWRGATATALRTFIRPWLETARENGGRIATHWNSIRGSGAHGGGARTGRLSSEPNFQNIPSPDKRADLVRSLELDDADLPNPRRYILPDDDSVIIGADFSQQELRILAHFENGPLLDMYRRFPEMDVHTYVQLMIKEITGVELIRKVIKVINFCIIYGGGAPAVSAQSGMTLSESKDALNLYAQTFPSIWELRNAFTEGVETVGGRICYAEPPRVIDGRLRRFEYKLLNWLIQGSAADQMKELLRSLDRVPARFMLTVHDEVAMSAARKEADKALAALKEAMLGTAKTLRISTPFKVDGYVGGNWAEIEKR